MLGIQLDAVRKIAMDWRSHAGTFPDVRWGWLKNQKADHPAPGVTSPTTPYDDLEAKQKLFYDTMVNLIKTFSVAWLSLLLYHLDGQAGTGKPTVIESMCAAVEHMAPAGHPSPTLRAAPTGVVACKFGGSRLHSLVILDVVKR